MILLHTSDWHLGRALYGRSRYDEFQAFLDWLAQAIETHAVDALLVAGDVFDTSTPSNRAQQLYYRFLCRVAASRCRHVVVIAGNHDSPSFLDAPKELLKVLQVHVVGQPCPDPADEVLLLRDAQGRPELLVCAVPYLRDRDIRTAEAGESLQDKERKLLEGIGAHYAAVARAAQARRAALDCPVPIVAMGHLFTAGGHTIEGDGVRELYVGSLAHVGAGIFPDCLDYLALGHLHVAQQVGGHAHLRYCGSPLPMGFGEARQGKSVCLVTLDEPPGAGGRAAVQVAQLPIPVFQALERVRGDWDAIAARLAELKAAAAPIWLEVIYEGQAVIGDLRQRLDAAVADTPIEILRVKNSRLAERILARIDERETLDDLDEHQVFERCLAAHEVPAAQHEALRQAYREAVLSLQQQDARAQ
ncbi:exonuclease SbcCD subunit D C-terminal domain-containing protein [Orrella sp. JC864]|uniref:exonuclease SbcCD subunit D C-terminal domain-containing protein n=1 Tax=Orrella sp. JC864 TaxID=3120298 RepID=UPI003009ADEE